MSNLTFVRVFSFIDNGAQAGNSLKYLASWASGNYRFVATSCGLKSFLSENPALLTCDTCNPEHF